ncbi:hypothetical protein JXB28_04715 [Candidatus Woesearchaeota archaeon]|nr:hypothetical protein [Candidatus Woesearchaeota archaeon]
MIFLNPTRDFFLAASKHAKESLVKNLNYIEAEIIMAQEALIRLKAQGMTPAVLNSFENKLDDLKRLLASKRKEFSLKTSSSN